MGGVGSWQRTPRRLGFDADVAWGDAHTVGRRAKGSTIREDLCAQLRCGRLGREDRRRLGLRAEASGCRNERLMIYHEHEIVGFGKSSRERYSDL
jgi:hypothetical protein